MTALKIDAHQLRDGMDEIVAAVERLREEIERLTEQRNALEKGNLELYLKLTKVDF